MRKIILFIASSLDGFIARTDGSVDWLFTDQDYGYQAFYDSIDTVIMGRQSYESALEISGGYPYKEKTGYVFSRSKGLKRTNDVEFISEDIPTFVRGLRKKPGKDIWLMGGAEIVRILLNEGLIDRIDLFVHPIILGKGIALFNNIKKSIKLDLIKTGSFDSGLLQLSYRMKP